MQQCTVYILYFTAHLLYSFGCHLHPSSGEQETVVVDHWYKSYVTIGWTVWLVTH
jgi:hypothetical protein